ncbi:hypothetical protein F5Y19DRAFT_431797 [Xylariaceae sp. FL1651]|nr:hypothetical protein F5Y19DRAFT_431797 [Xylariaceae sp. FL1651]
MINGAPFTTDVSLVAQGDGLRAIDTRVVFDDSAVDVKRLRRLITNFDAIIRLYLFRVRTRTRIQRR